MMAKKGLSALIGENPKVLILGSLPGDKSLNVVRYYENRSNRFWKVIEAALGKNPGELVNAEYSEKEATLKQNGIALWDVYKSADREGSLDEDIKDKCAEYNDIVGLLNQKLTIDTVIFNGKKAEEAFAQSNQGLPNRKIAFYTMTSTSSMSRWKKSDDDLIIEWKGAFAK
jgi:hypoxanthine-DNA glycosylase